MASTYLLVPFTISLLKTFVCVRGDACAPHYCATIICEGVTSSSCTASDQVFIPHGDTCGCCPVCVKKIEKGERCGGLKLLLNAVQEAGCEHGTMCNKKTDEGYYVCD